MRTLKQGSAGTYYMVMEYLPGGTLKELIEREGPLPARRALEVTLQIARALSEAHEQGVIHRDIKPENVLLTRRGDAKVTDFGIAKAAEAATRLTRTGVIPGTPHYLSPEQVQGQDVSSRSDLYSLEIVLYEMLTGKLPFDGETTQEILNKHLHEQVRPLEETNPNVNVPERVEAVVVRLLAKDPEERYPDADALIADLERARDEPDTVVDDTRPTIPDLERMRDDLDAVEDDTRPTTVRVPNLIGQKPARTRGMLAEAGLSLGTQDQAPSETVPEGEIVEQDPPAGTEVEADSSVSVTVSSGPEEATTVPAPSDRSTEEAEHASSNAAPVPATSRTEEKQRVGPEDSSRQTAQGATVRPGKRAKPWISVGLFCTVVAAGLIAALAYSLTGEETVDFTLTSTLGEHSGPVTSVAFSPDGKLLASGSTDGTVKIWERG